MEAAKQTDKAQHTMSTVGHNRQNGGDAMTQYSKLTALYSRLSVGDEDRNGGEG